MPAYNIVSIAQVGTVTTAHAHTDIDDAVAIGLDGFALNIGDPMQSFVRDTMGSMFDYALSKDFKLFISMDLSAAGEAKKRLVDYRSLFRDFLGHGAWYLGPNGFPFVSTFSDGGLTNDAWIEWKNSLASEIYFVPNFDGTLGYYENNPGWWQYWGPVVDGLFSWESSWPLRVGKGGMFPGDVSPDVKVMRGTAEHGKSYMIGLSPLQYKNAYNTNVYRAGANNLPERMRNILRMSPQPDYVQAITWVSSYVLGAVTFVAYANVGLQNDGPESHYIGNLWPEQNTDAEPTLYATQASAPHNPWRDLIQSFVAAYRKGGDETSMAPRSGLATGCMWYKTILQSTTCSNAKKPDGYDTAEDAVYFAVMVEKGTSHWGMQLRVTNNGVESGSHQIAVDGLNYGSARIVKAGSVEMNLLSSNGTVILTASGGECITNDCPKGIYDMNYQVIALAEKKGANVITGI